MKVAIDAICCALLRTQSSALGEQTNALLLLKREYDDSVIAPLAQGRLADAIEAHDGLRAVFELVSSNLLPLLENTGVAVDGATAATVVGLANLCLAGIGEASATAPASRTARRGRSRDHGQSGAGGGGGGHGGGGEGFENGARPSPSFRPAASEIVWDDERKQGLDDELSALRSLPEPVSPPRRPGKRRRTTGARDASPARAPASGAAPSATTRTITATKAATAIMTRITNWTDIATATSSPGTSRTSTAIVTGNTTGASDQTGESVHDGNDAFDRNGAAAVKSRRTETRRSPGAPGAPGPDIHAAASGTSAYPGVAQFDTTRFKRNRQS